MFFPIPQIEGNRNSQRTTTTNNNGNKKQTSAKQAYKNSKRITHRSNNKENKHVKRDKEQNTYGKICEQKAPPQKYTFIHQKR